MYLLYTNKNIKIVLIGIIIGVIVGVLSALQVVWANNYIQYKMFRLIFLVFQKHVNYSVLFTVIGLLGLYMVWFFLVEKIQLDKNKIIGVFKVAFVFLIVIIILNWVLREFMDIPLLYGIKNILKVILRCFKGNLPYGNGLLILKSQYLGFIAFMFGAIVFIPFIYNGIKKFYATGLLNIVQKRAFLNISVLTGVALLIGNLIIVINQKESRPEGPNVVFIVIDALRADHLSSYGYNRLSSPNIDKLSIDGIRFTNAISQGNRTSLSMPSMLTGLYTSDHGYNMLQKIESRIVPLSARFASIGEVLRNAGYITYAASCQPWISPESGYGQGFDYFEMVSSLGDNLSDEKTVKKALDWLDDNRDEKFFIFLDLMGPHTPYDPPKPYKSLYSSGHEVRSKLISDLNDLYFKEKYGEYYKLLLNTSKENISTEDLKQLIELYDAKIAFTDQQIGSLIEKLKSLNIYDNTLIILTADHGEAFLDHGKFLHGRSVYNEEVHVPLIMTCLDRLPKNKEIDDIVELVDILPTIASISGIPISEIKMRGNPLFPIKGNSYDSDQFAYTEGSGHIKYMTNQWSIICEIGSGECELYDLESDPGETYNLSGMKPDIVTNLKNKLFDIIDEKMYPSFQEAKTIRIPEKTKKTLKSLGYLQ